MSLEILGVGRTSDTNLFRVLVRADGDQHVFVVRLRRDPVAALSAPHSFWSLFGANQALAQTVVDCVRRVASDDLVDWPVTVPVEPQAGAPSDARLFSAASGSSVSTESLRLAVGCLARHADTSLFPRSFEFSLIETAWHELERSAVEINLSNHAIQGARQLLAPKSSAGLRLATQLDPLDTILLTACVFELGRVAEAARVPVTEGVVHSFRFDPESDSLWDPNYGYHTFSQRIREHLADDTLKFVVETDISAFYHRVPIDASVHSLERAGGNRRLLEGVRKSLGSFSVTGLPVGPMPSAFFAEAVLNDVDMALLASKATFVRYNDDYRFFCKTESEARAHLQTLADLLWRAAGLTLQDAKTRIYDSTTYEEQLQTDGWLGALKRLVTAKNSYQDTSPDDLAEDEQHLVTIARSVLLQSVEATHPAWIRLCRKALRALPVGDRLELIPALLDQFPRLKPVAKEISHSLVLFGRQRPRMRGQLLEEVVESLVGDDSARADSDFGRTWLARSFATTAWPDAERLVEVSNRWPQDVATKREIILALREAPTQVGRLNVDPSEPWQYRASLSTLGRAALVGRGRPSSAEEKWHSTLEALIASASDDADSLD